MKTVKVTRGQYHALQNLTRKEVAMLRKYPKVLAESKRLLRACKSVIKKIEAIPEFPTELALLLKHLLVSHHGAYEFGSPKLPQTVEAVILHSLDDLDGKIQAIQNLPEKEPGSKWTAFHRAYGRSFYRNTPNADP